MAETKTRLDERTIGRIPVAQWYEASSTGSDAYVISLTPAITAYEEGRFYAFKADVANTGAATLDIDGVGAIALKKHGGVDLATGDILAGQIVYCVYDGTNMQLISPTSNTIPVAQSYGASSGGTDAYAITLSPAPTAYETGRMYLFKADVANTGAATLNVNGLGAVTLKKNVSSDLEDNDILADAIITAIYDGTNMQVVAGLSMTSGNKKAYFGGDGSDGVVDGSSNITITGSNGTLIEKNYSSWAAAQGGGKSITITPTNCILYIKIRGDADFTGWAFNFSGKGGQGGAGGSAVSGTTLSGNPGIVGGSGLGVLYSITGGTNGLAGNNTVDATQPATDGAVRVLPVTLTAILASRSVHAGCGGGGGGGGSGGTGSSGTSGAGGSGGHGGGCVLIEVFGDVTFSGTTATVAGTAGTVGGDASGTEAAGGGGGGGGGGGTFVILYNGSLTGTLTPTVSGGAGASGGTAVGGAMGRTAGSSGSGGASLINSSAATTSFTGVNVTASTAGATGTSLIVKNTFLV